MATQLYHQLRLDTIDLDVLCRVTDLCKEKASSSPKWLNALERAYDFLLNPHVETIQIGTDGSSALIPSATSDTVYNANGTCGCPAYTRSQNPCWHRATARLITRYKEALTQEADYLMHATERAEQRGDMDTYERLSTRWTVVENALMAMEVSG